MLHNQIFSDPVTTSVLASSWDDWQARLSEAEAGGLSPAHRVAEDDNRAPQRALLHRPALR